MPLPMQSAVRRAAVLVTCALAAALLALAPAAQAAPKCSAAQGQALIDGGQYQQAVQEFTCVIGADPTAVEGYRGRIEAEVLLGRYSDAVRDYQRVAAVVLPVHPGAHATILAGYADRLSADPDDVRALTGASFARWWVFDYPQALHLLQRLLDVEPDDPYGTLFRGSARMLKGSNTARGVEDLERGLAMAPDNAHVRFIVADAYTYGVSDPERALSEATLALDWGLDTPRIHAIIAAAHNALGDLATAAEHIQRHNDLVTTELLPAPALAPGGSLSLDLVPGRTYAIPVAVTAGETISISTSSPDIWDTIAVLQAPDGTPVVGSDDADAYFAAFDWVAEETGTYTLEVTSFESVSTGELVVTRG
jgi:tetratricopeptide (TPR) repeat protein